MNVFSFLTISQPAEGMYKESGSKFFAFAYPVSSESEIKERVDLLKKKYFDATHHCFAWILGADKARFRAVDDGEPNHSAGDPILGQIRSKNLTNVLVVVVRYYGGTKLGVGGLIQAYKISAEAALNSAIIVEQDVTQNVELHFAHNENAEVMRLIKEYDLTLLSQNYAEDCKLELEVKLGMRDRFLAKLNLLVDMGHKISFKEV
ncbi:MAG: YigZ family protein [Flammeovirgaceae bacterium]|nr:YigZ family protein [Flammeovirgaceae bacterium]